MADLPQLSQALRAGGSMNEAVKIMRESGITMQEALDMMRKCWLEQTLAAHNGNQCQAAEELDMHRNTLSRQLDEFDIIPAEYIGRKRGYRQGGNRLAADSGKRAAHTRQSPTSTAVVRDSSNSVRKGGRGESPEPTRAGFQPAIQSPARAEIGVVVHNFNCGSLKEEDL